MFSRCAAAWARFSAVLLGLSGCVTAPPPRLESVLAQSRQDGKPIVLEFFTTWCGPCKRFARKTLPDPEVQKALRDVVFVRYDAEHGTGMAAAARYGVTSYPSFLVLDGSGALCAQGKGADAESKTFVKLLHKASDATRSRETVMEQLSTQPDSPVALLTAARWHVAHRYLDEGLALYEQAEAKAQEHKQAPESGADLAAQARWEGLKIRRVLDQRRRLVSEASAVVLRYPGTRTAARALRMAALSGEMTLQQRTELLGIHIGALPAVSSGQGPPAGVENDPAALLEDAVVTALAARVPSEARALAEQLVGVRQRAFRAHGLLAQALSDLSQRRLALEQLDQAEAGSENLRQHSEVRKWKGLFAAGEPLLVRQVEEARVEMMSYFEALEGPAWMDGVAPISRFLMANQ